MTASQTRDILILNILGAGLLCLPYTAEGGPLAAVIGAAAALLLALLTNGVSIHSRGLCILYFIKTVVLSAMLLRIFAGTVTTTLLHDTGTAPISAAMLVTALYGGSESGAARGRMAHIFVFFSAAVLITSLAMPLKNADPARLMFYPEKDLVLRSVLTAFTFFPLEAVYFENSAQKSKTFSAAAAGGAVLIAAVFVHRLCSGRSEMSVAELYQNGILSDTAARHHEGLLMLCMTTLVYFMLSTQIYCAASALKKAAKTDKGAISAAFVIFVLCLIPQTADETRSILCAALLSGGLIFTVCIPIFQKAKKLLPALILVLLTGCTGCEPEAREHILGIFISENGVTLAAAQLPENGSESGKSTFYDGRGETLAEAMHDAEKQTSKKIYLGHTLFCAIEKSAADKEQLSSLITLFRSDDDLSPDVSLIVVDSTEALKDAEWSGGDITAYMRGYRKRGGTFNAAGLLRTLEDSGGDAVIPVIECKNGTIRSGGGAVIKDGNFAGSLDKDEYEALHWLMNGGNEVYVNIDGSVFSFSRTGLKKTFSDRAVFTAAASARLVQGSKDGDMASAQKILSHRISAALYKVMHVYGCDCLEIKERFKQTTGKDTDIKDIPTEIKIKTKLKGT